MEGSVAKGLRDFRGSPRDSLAGRNSNQEKHLHKFFKIFVLTVLVTCSQLDLVEKIACFAQICQFLNVFSFPSNISDCSLSSPFQTHRVTLKEPTFLHHFSLNLLEKGMVFLLSYSTSCLLHVLS